MRTTCQSKTLAAIAQGRTVSKPFVEHVTSFVGPLTMSAIGPTLCGRSRTGATGQSSSLLVISKSVLVRTAERVIIAFLNLIMCVVKRRVAVWRGSQIAELRLRHFWPNSRNVKSYAQIVIVLGLIRGCRVVRGCSSIWQSTWLPTRWLQVRSLSPASTSSGYRSSGYQRDRFAGPDVVSWHVRCITTLHAKPQPLRAASSRAS